MAKWEDTVMNENQIGSRPLYCFADEEMIRLGLSRLELFRLCKDAGFLNTQAKITWEARDKLAKEEVEQAEKRGYNKGVEDKLGMEDALQQRNDELRAEVAEAEQRGIQKVVEFVNKNWRDMDFYDLWQAFLKSIGVNSKEK